MNAVIFDIDGTIVDVSQSGIYLLYSTIALHFKKPSSTISSMNKHWYGIDEHAIYEELGVSQDEFWDIFKKKDTAEFRDKYLFAYGDIAIIPQLQSQGIFVGFNTDAPYNHGLSQLNKVGIMKPYIIANHKGIPRKPNPAGLIKIINENHLDVTKTVYVGNSEKDIIAGIRAGVRTVLIDRGNLSSLNVTPDYIIKSLCELAILPELFYEKLSRDINITNLDKPVSNEEQERLIVHFKRIKHHSLVMGVLCKSLNEYLRLDKQQAFALGIFHDIDYATSFLDAAKHGCNSRLFIDTLLTQDRYLDICEHTNKSSNNKRALFLYAMEGWLKRFVHAARSADMAIDKLSLTDIQRIYSSKDPRRNELLTQSDKIENFKEFVDWQNECSAIVKSLPFSELQLHHQIVSAFNKYTSIISSLSVNDERGQTYDA